MKHFKDDDRMADKEMIKPTKQDTEVFFDIYKNRPFKEQNHGGMLLPHLFATWFWMKQLNPKKIIESGTFQGLGTWVIEQACPDAKIYSIDIYPNQRKYISPTVEYFDKDITEYEWDNTAVIHFDDHMNALDRVLWAKEKGFKYLFFEDNYPEGQGDCVSLKQNKEFREKHGTYEEFPPVFARNTNRWGLPWNFYETPDPIFDTPDETNAYYQEAKSYTWICLYTL